MEMNPSCKRYCDCSIFTAPFKANLIDIILKADSLLKYSNFEFTLS